MSASISRSKLTDGMGSLLTDLPGVEGCSEHTHGVLAVHGASCATSRPGPSSRHRHSSADRATAGVGEHHPLAYSCRRSWPHRSWSPISITSQSSPCHSIAPGRRSVLSMYGTDHLMHVCVQTKSICIRLQLPICTYYDSVQLTCLFFSYGSILAISRSRTPVWPYDSPFFFFFSQVRTVLVMNRVRTGAKTSTE